MNHAARVVTTVAVLFTLAACAETTVDLDTANSTAADDSVPSTTVAITGTAAELLPEMAIEMSGLSAQIAEDGGEKETLARIEEIWLVIRPQVESETPELVVPIDTTVDMARTAVIRIRPADADKAFQLFTGLVDSYTGDG